MWVMQLILSRRHQQLLLEFAAQAQSNECCGLLLGSDSVVDDVELTSNVAINPQTEFEIDPAALIAAEKRARQGGPQILGYFHSHPNGNGAPSAQDIHSAVADGRRWLIIADGEIFVWRPIGGSGGVALSFCAESFVEG
jgi:proteasome lid subunit RPN8/RPN11